MLWFDVEEEEGETEKSGDGLERILWWDCKRFWCNCGFACPTTNKLLVADSDSLGDIDGKPMPPLNRGWNIIEIYAHHTFMVKFGHPLRQKKCVFFSNVKLSHVINIL